MQLGLSVGGLAYVSKSPQPCAAEGDGNPDQYLPKAATCFFALELPDYSSREVMREKLLYAGRALPPFPVSSSRMPSG